MAKQFPVLNRACGTCTLCCKVMAVKELQKPAAQNCSLLSPGRGCSTYADRPVSCRSFECGWLQGWLPEDWKPDHAHVVLVGDADDDRLLHVHYDPQRIYPKWVERGLNKISRTGRCLVLCAGERRKFVGDQKVLIDILQKRGVDQKIIDAIKQDQRTFDA